MAYLKQSLPEATPVPVVISARLGQEEGKFGPQFKYQVTWNGQTYDHSASLTEEKALQRFQPGQAATVEKKKNSFGTLSLFWTADHGVPAPAPQRAQAAQQEAMIAQSEKEAMWKKKDIGMTLGMLLKLFMRDGTSFDAALAEAKKHRPAFVAAVNEIYQAEQMGVDLSHVALDTFRE